MISKKILAASILAAMGTSAHALDPIKVGQWDLTINGSVNAFYTSNSCDNAIGNNGYGGPLAVCTGGADTTNIQNGLLPGVLSFTAATTYEGMDVKGVISLNPGTSNDRETGFTQTVGDQRQLYIEFGNATMGRIKIGRDFQLFQLNTILSDMSLLGVGTGADGGNAGGNTTLGGIGTGYIYATPVPQITYTLPTPAALNLTVGLYQPTLLVNGIRAEEPGIQGSATYNYGAGKVWASFASHERSDGVGAAKVDFESTGYELGGTVGFGGLQLMLSGFSGEGMGLAVPGLFGHTNAGAKRDSNGYHAQATYTIDKTKFGVSYGKSELDLATGEAASDLIRENEAVVLGVYHSLTPALTLVGEYITQEQRAQDSTLPKAEGKTIALGAILFF